MSKLLSIIEESSASPIQKKILSRFVRLSMEAEQKTQKIRDLILEVAHATPQEIILSTDEVKIYTVDYGDTASLKYPFRFIYFKNGIWDSGRVASSSLDAAFLQYLGRKHIDNNGFFAGYCAKILDIDL